MGFILFILVNATLFLRPGEIVPELLGLPIYEFLIISCLLFSAADLIAYLESGSLIAKPVTLCVFALLGVIVVSKMAAWGSDLEQTVEMAVYFFKVLVYYVLVVSVLNTPQRLRTFVFCLACFTAVLAALGVLQFYEIIQLPSLKPLQDTELDATTGHDTVFLRLQGTGAFQDPNEFCIILATAVPLMLYLLGNPGLSRVFWLAPLALVLYGVNLTHSRGGFLALLAGLGAFAWARWGTRRTALIMGLGLPVLFLAFAGRQTDLSATSGTGQTRVQVWSEWLRDFREAPVFGTGMRIKNEHEEVGKKRAPWEEDKYVAHNSYLHAFTELGFPGGTLFLGAVCLALTSLIRPGRPPTHIVDPEQERLQPFLLATVVTFAVGMLSLSLCYFNATYLMLGLAEAHGRVTRVAPPLPALRFTAKVAGGLVLASLVFLIGIYAFVRVFVRWT